MTNVSVLVLAGKRSGKLDAMAAVRGVSHKCVVPVAGVPLIEHVLGTIARTLPDAEIQVSIEDFSVIADVPTVASLHQAARLFPVPAQSNLVESISLAASSASFPLLITTADNAMLTADAIRAMLMSHMDADALVGMARKEQIMAAHPTGKNRYYEFRDGGFSNCNLFLLRNAQAFKGAEAFRSGGQFLKTKGRLLKTFGVLSALMYRSGWFSIATMFDRISARLGVTIRPIILDDGRLAIDVDDEASLAAVEDMLLRNGGPVSAIA